MTAVISDCGAYRYWLGRPGRGAPLVWCMLNPSTADATIDDPTIKRVRSFSKGMAFSVINLNAYRATDPAELGTVADPIGPHNDHYIAWCLKVAPVVVCAWGANATHEREVAFIEMALAAGCKMVCLGLNKDGSPKHPLYVKGSTPFVEYSPL